MQRWRYSFFPPRFLNLVLIITINGVFNDALVLSYEHSIKTEVFMCGKPYV
jgi:hypothetical protein